MNEIIKNDLDIIIQSDLDWEKFKNTTVLVSGAYGMLPSYMVFVLLYLNEKYPGMNIRVVALCRNYEKAAKRFSYYLDDPFLKIVPGNVADDISFRQDIHYIIHGASPASSQFYGTDPVSVITPNVIGTRNLLNLAREKNSKGFLFFSSGEVCGKVNKEVISETDCGYLDPMDLRSCYGESKRMGENMCQCWHYQYGVPAVAVRPEHTYGPTMDLENDRRVFAEFVSDAVNGRDIVVKSDGLSVRNFCYISDAADGFFRAILKGSPGESYNVGNNMGRTTIGELAGLISGLFPERGIKVVYDKRQEDPSYIENPDKRRPILSTGKLERLGFKCQFNLKEGFYRTIKSFISEEN